MHAFSLAARLRLVALVTLAILATPASSLAQVARAAAPRAAAPGAESSRRDTILHSWTNPDIATLVLVDSIEYPSARALVIRRPGPLPNNIILVTSATTARELAHAVGALMGSRRSKGDTVDREMRAIVRPLTAGGRKSSRDDARAAADLERVQRAPAFTIPGVATGPAIVIRMRAGAANARASQPR